MKDAKECKKKSNYYFNNDYVMDCIRKYQSTGNIKYRDKAIIEAGKIIDAIINVYRGWRFEERDVLKQEGYAACLKAIETFNEKKFKNKSHLAHRFFSIVVKKHLAFITYKKSKIKTRTEFVDDLTPYLNKDNSYKQKYAFDYKLDNLIHFLKNCLFEDSKKKLKIVKYLERYFDLNQNFFEKRDFINYTKTHGFTHSYVRNFIKEIETSMSLFEIYNRNLHNKNVFLAGDDDET